MIDMNVRLFRKTSKENLRKAIDALAVLRSQYLDEASNEVWDQLYDAGRFLEARLAVYESFEEVVHTGRVDIDVDAEAIERLQKNVRLRDLDLDLS